MPTASLNKKQKRDQLWADLSLENSTHGVTGIGSLPHASVDSAIAYSFRHNIPFLPQLPLRNPREYMIPQALFALPGLILKPGGYAVVDLDLWAAGTYALRQTLSSTENDQLVFTPGNSDWSCFTPFFWELEERRMSFAKIQVAGPFTCISVLQASDGAPLIQHSEVTEQITELLMRSSLHWVNRLRRIGVQPLIFLDEPGLGTLGLQSPMQKTLLHSLKLQVQALQNAGALVGLHCCSNSPWVELMALGFDILSIDAKLSLGSLLQSQSDFTRFIEDGGRLALGIIPTHMNNDSQVEVILRRTRELLSQSPACRTAFNQAIFTASCGLALETPETAERILNSLTHLSKIKLDRIF